MFFLNIPFITLWLCLSLLRVATLFVHYFQCDPYGFPIVAQPWRFIPYAICSEVGAIAVLLIPFFIVYTVADAKKFLLRISWICGSLYLIFGVMDLEVYRYLKQHINISFITTYLRPSLLQDQTLIHSISGDMIGTVLAALFIVLSIIIGIIGFFKKVPQIKNIKIQGLVLLLIAGIFGTSLQWLGFFYSLNNRKNRLLPPLYSISLDAISLFNETTEKPEDAVVAAVFSRNRIVDVDSMIVHNTEYPFVKMTLEEFCKRGGSDSRCLIDYDGDGFDKISDCNDLDSNIYPSAVDIESDGIDQDCNGIDNMPMNIVFIIGESFHRKIILNELESNNRLLNFKKNDELWRGVVS